MQSQDQDVAPRRTTTGSVLPALPGGRTHLDEVAIRLGVARRCVSRALHGFRAGTPRPTSARMLVLVFAHDQEATIGRSLTALLTQSRVPDRIVLLADDCTDRTEEIARRFRGVTVMRTVDNTEREVGALDQGWRRWQAGYDRIAGIDAGTVLAPDCLQQLEEELVHTPRPGGVVAGCTSDPGLGSTAVARLPVRLQRREPSSRTRDALQENQEAHVLGGRVCLFSAEALRQVTERRPTRGPWSSVPDDDVQLNDHLRGMGYQTLVCPSVRAHAGPRLTVRSLRAQPRSGRRT